MYVRTDHAIGLKKIDIERLKTSIDSNWMQHDRIQ